MDAKILFQLNESYRHGVYNQIDEEVLSEEELLDIQEWVEALIEEGYDLDEYTDEELYEAYLDEVRGGGKIDPVSGFPKHGEKVSRTPQEAGLLMSPLDRAKARKNALIKRGNTKQANQIQSRFIRPTERGVNRAIHASNVARADEKKRLMSPQNEEFDLYDLVSEYLVSEGFCDSYEDADVIMANMSEEWRDSILDEAKKYEKHILKGLPSETHSTVKKAARALSRKEDPKTDRQRALADKLSSLKSKNSDSDLPLRGARRGSESSTDK